MSRLALLSAVSGAGKSTALALLDLRHAAVVELDEIVERQYTTFGVGPADGGVYRYDRWRAFLDGQDNHAALRSAVRLHFLELRGGCGNAILSGNHFALPTMTRLVTDALAADFSRIGRFFLDVPADVVYRNRVERGQPGDRGITRENVNFQVNLMRRNLDGLGFIRVTTQSLRASLTSFFFEA